MELQEEVLQQEPLKDVRMRSATEYCASLEVPGGFNWQRAVHTLLVHFKLSLLLPLSDVFVKKPKDIEKDGPSKGSSELAYLILRDAMSPLHFFGLGALTACFNACMIRVLKRHLSQHSLPQRSDDDCC